MLMVDPPSQPKARIAPSTSATWISSYTEGRGKINVWIIWTEIIWTRRILLQDSKCSVTMVNLYQLFVHVFASPPAYSLRCLRHNSSLILLKEII